MPLRLDDKKVPVSEAQYIKGLPRPPIPYCGMDQIKRTLKGSIWRSGFSAVKCKTVLNLLITNRVWD